MEAGRGEPFVSDDGIVGLHIAIGDFTSVYLGELFTCLPPTVHVESDVVTPDFGGVGVTIQRDKACLDFGGAYHKGNRRQAEGGGDDAFNAPLLQAAEPYRT